LIRQREFGKISNDGTRSEMGDWQVKDGVLHQYTDNVKEGNAPSGQAAAGEID
jgi:hypothetical protein